MFFPSINKKSKASEPSLERYIGNILCSGIYSQCLATTFPFIKNSTLSILHLMVNSVAVFVHAELQDSVVCSYVGELDP